MAILEFLDVCQEAECCTRNPNWLQPTYCL